jgi:hypothetical protein
MTVVAGKREFCLSYADRELMVLMGLRGADRWFPEGAAFVQATGIYDNWTVAGGQNTRAWVAKPRVSVLQAALAVQQAAARETRELRKRKAAWAEKMPALTAFLRASRARVIRIRHHYSWN